MTALTLMREATQVDEYLRDKMRERGWNIARLAEACDVSDGLASKWLSANPRYRVTPSPPSCEKIADALGVDLDELLVLAGHRPSRGASPVATAAPDEVELLAHFRQLDQAHRPTVIEIVRSLSAKARGNPHANSRSRTRSASSTDDQTPPEHTLETRYDHLRRTLALSVA